jgi:hypothetical protein
MPVPDFSPGEVLTAAAMDSIGLWLVKSQTIGTGVASVTVTDAFPTSYRSFNVVITGGVASTSANLALTLGASSTGYFAGYSYVNIGTGATAIVTNNNASSWSAVGLATTAQISMNLFLQNPGQAAHTMLQGSVGRAAADNVNSYQGGHGVATAYTSFTITPSAGTLTGGIISVYGYKN